jgi:hypothetical protein
MSDVCNFGFLSHMTQIYITEHTSHVSVCETNFRETSTEASLLLFIVL